MCQGMGSACMLSNAIPTVRHCCSPEDLGLALALNAVIKALTSVVTPFFIGRLIDAYGWQAAFLTVVPICLVGLVVSSFGLPKCPTVKSAGSDVLGSILLFMTLLCFVLSLATLGMSNIRPRASLVLFVASVVMACLLYMVEQRVRDPVIPFWLLGQPRI
ncbi:hypothetical protein KIPB_014958, partial [Kipferlia bialata]|eukprot:g14958.t1